MKLVCSILFAIALVTGCGGGGPEAQIQKGLVEAFRPQAGPATTRAVLAALAEDPNPERLRTELGTNNLTVFLLTLPEENPLTDTQNYEWAWPKPDVRLLAEKLDVDLCAVTLDDLESLSWQETAPGTMRGSFAVEMDYGLQAKFLFEARGSGYALHVTKLAVAKRDSDDIVDGFLVFDRP